MIRGILRGMASVRWFAVLTNVRAEPLAAKHLRRQGYGVLYLHYPATVSHARRLRRVIKPYFPRYLFAACLEDLPVGPITRTTGVAALVQAGPDPLEIPHPVIDELASRGDADGLVLGLEEPYKRKIFRLGQEVAIARGPLQGLVATITGLSMNGQGAVCALRWLGRSVNVNFDFEALAVFSPALRSAPN
jgi:transcriptional antiterminator RfaH